VNVTCTKCGKKYVIADDKVAGKTSVKIRCKQCQSLIAVAVGPMSSPSGVVAMAAGAPPPPSDSQQSDAPPAQAAEAAPSWYAMVAGKQEGPFDVRALQERVTRGEVTLRTYLWKAGMSDWKRASDVPEVSPIFAAFSASATATGSTQTSSQSPPGSRSGVGRDVAVANEVPSPELTRRKPATTTAFGAAAASAGATPASQEAASAAAQAVVAPGAAAAAAPSEASEPTPVADPAPGAESTAVTDPAAGAGPASAAAGGAGTAAPDAAHDPFAQLAPLKEGEAPPLGEATKFFIARAGVNRRNPPWKIALFVAALVGLPVAVTYLLSSLKVVELPTVTRTTEDGREVQENFFSPGGMSGLRDLLTGDAQRKKAEAELARQAAVAREQPSQPKPGSGEGEAKRPDPAPPGPGTSNNALAALYASDELKTRGPRVRHDEAEPGSGTQVNTAGLSQEAAMKIVGDKAKAFQQCVEAALHRNPNLAVGNIVVVLNVGASGAVKAASVEPKKHEGSDWAQCMVAAGKRIVFPASDGETQLELPFKVGVAVSP
jgi:GYF domain 2/zinc-ribbon domain